MPQDEVESHVARFLRTAAHSAAGHTVTQDASHATANRPHAARPNVALGGGPILAPSRNGTDSRWSINSAPDSNTSDSDKNTDPYDDNPRGQDGPSLVCKTNATCGYQKEGRTLVSDKNATCGSAGADWNHVCSHSEMHDTAARSSTDLAATCVVAPVASFDNVVAATTRVATFGC